MTPPPHILFIFPLLHHHQSLYWKVLSWFRVINPSFTMCKYVSLSRLAEIVKKQDPVWLSSKSCSQTISLNLGSMNDLRGHYEPPEIECKLLHALPPQGESLEFHQIL